MDGFKPAGIRYDMILMHEQTLWQVHTGGLGLAGIRHQASGITITRGLLEGLEDNYRCLA